MSLYSYFEARQGKTKQTIHSEKKQNGHDMFSLIFHVAIIPAITISCVHLGHNCSSYFTLSFLKIPPSVAGIGTVKADTELACAFRCCARRECTEAVFFKVARRCFLYDAKEKVLAKFQVGCQETKTGYVRIKKVRQILSKMLGFN